MDFVSERRRVVIVSMSSNKHHLYETDSVSCKQTISSYK